MARRKETGMTAGFMTQLHPSAPTARPSRDTAIMGHGTSGFLDESKITSKGQMTLPKIVRAALGVAVGDTVQFVMKDNRIVVEPASQEPVEDPALAAFLDTLEGSIDKATPFPVELLKAMKALTDGIEVDLDDPIEGDVVI